MSGVLIILLFLLTISASHAQRDTNELSMTASPTTSSGPSLSPTIAPTITSFKPTASNQPSIVPSTSSVPSVSSQPTSCVNTPDFLSEQYVYDTNCSWAFKNLTCDHTQVSCSDLFGNLGAPADHCCKCKDECSGQCNNPIFTDDYPPECYDDDYSNNFKNLDFGDLFTIVIIVCVVCCGSCIAWCIYDCMGDRPARREVQQTMTARRQEQRENNTQGLTEEERNNTRYELFVTKFYFQAVLPDKSNTTANILRNSSSSLPDEEHPNQHHDDDHASAVGSKQNSLSSRLSSWRRPSPKDECCICLEGYTVGETICAPMTTECNHVFHEGCILEWLKTSDHCPLCRVELLKD